MSLSNYHQKFSKQGDEEIRRKADAKEEELAAIFREVLLKTESNPARLAVLGCGDRRFVTLHKEIFEKVLQRNVEVTTFDIVTEHLSGEPGVVQHDCTLPLRNPPYDLVYGHVLLKFIEPEKQFSVLKNSFDALKPGGIAIHVFDKEETEVNGKKLPDGLWVVPFECHKTALKEAGIKYQEIPLRYGPALVLLSNF